MFTKKWLPSPFFKSRGDFPLNTIVIHHIGSKDKKLYSVNGTLTWFTNLEVHRNKQTGKIENKVSAHYVIPRENHKGNDLYHLVEDTSIAYHAGRSQWTYNNVLKKYINRYSVGIELEGDGNLVEYTDFQYDVLEWLVKDLMSAHKIEEFNIVGHEDISPGRKVDPGIYFDWKRLRSKIKPPLVSLDKETPSSDVEEKEESNSNSDKVDDKEFFMSDGSDTSDSKGFIGVLLKILLNIFNKK